MHCIGRRVFLTDAGRKLYKYARRMDEMSREIRSQFSADQYMRGSLTIRVPETIASIYMPGVIDGFYRDHPKVSLEFLNCSDEQLREELNSDRIDLAFLLTDTIHFNEVNIKQMRTEKLILVSGPDHPLAGRPCLTFGDLGGYPLLLPKTD